LVANEAAPVYYLNVVVAERINAAPRHYHFAASAAHRSRLRLRRQPLCL
jgi:hypothetical protein